MRQNLLQSMTGITNFNKRSGTGSTKCGYYFKVKRNDPHSHLVPCPEVTNKTEKSSSDWYDISNWQRQSVIMSVSHQYISPKPSNRICQFGKIILLFCHDINNSSFCSICK